MEAPKTRVQVLCAASIMWMSVATLHILCFKRTNP